MGNAVELVANNAPTPSTARIRTAIIISGHGSNLQALIDAARAPGYPAEIVLVISNVANVYGLERAAAAGIPTVVIPHRNYDTREAFDAAMDAVLQQYMVQLTCLAGFMRILSGWFAAQWAGRLINIHPSLLPNHKGINTHMAVLKAGDTHHGATVHWVTEELDSGSVILQESFPVQASDTVESLKQKNHEVEHRIYPQALRLVASEMLSAKPA
jgi:formyltetrahydrofolate-dependent phosphoribosylglycinamide formyltransferase